MSVDPATWLLPFSATDPTAPNGDGRPWGDGTAMAARAAHGVPPYDTNCKVTTIIGGYAAMLAMRDALEQAITDGQAAEQAGSPPAGQRGHVYIADWRLNAQRDLSDANPWQTHTWKAADKATIDQTALGLVLRLMQAGVRVRILIWLPTKVSAKGAGPAHVEDHYYIARAVAAESDRLNKKWNLQDPIGVVGLDLRTAEGSIAGTHHQKMVVIRGPTQDVAFCGGVDLAFTRRDSPADPSSYDPAKTQFLNGDWQSANGFPPLAKSWPPSAALWPPDTTTNYSALAALDIPADRQESDLPETEDNPPKRDIYGFVAHVWHDQHLKLEGPIVSTLENQFAERWRDTARVFDLSDPANWFAGQVIFSSPAAFDKQTGAITPLPLPSSVASPRGASSTVQLLRTIPWRDSRTGPPFQRAEFTVMGGVVAAINAASELVWIFDQYFWSLPLARLLNYRVCQPGSGLNVIIILPPYADSQPKVIHLARQRALQELTDQAPAGRIGVYDLWDPRGNGRGIYCHAKTQTYDGSLMICGSANMNRRSLACDSESACAVLDPAVVSQHQQRLWALLFNGITAQSGTWPGLDLNQQGNGAKFFAAFDTAAHDPAAYLRPDPWQSSAPALPNGVLLPRGQFGSTAFIDRIFDPTSLDRVMESDVPSRDANGNLVTRKARLDDVVKRIEKCVRAPNGNVITPWRRQS